MEITLTLPPWFVDSSMIISQIVSPVSDKRVGSCYMDVPLYDLGRLGVCNDEIASSVSRATCCCTVGLGWGEVPGFCEPCPKNGTGRKCFLIGALCFLFRAVPSSVSNLCLLPVLSCVIKFCIVSMLVCVGDCVCLSACT